MIIGSCMPAIRICPNVISMTMNVIIQECIIENCISPILFSCYIDQLFSQLEHFGLGCHVGTSYAGAFGYADDIAIDWAIVAPSLQSLRKMISIVNNMLEHIV